MESASASFEPGFADVVDEVRPLRKKGWSDRGIARFTDLPLDTVRRAICLIDNPEDRREVAGDARPHSKGYERKSARPPAASKVSVARARAMIREGATHKEVAEHFGVKPSTVTRALASALERGK